MAQIIVGTDGLCTCSCGDTCACPKKTTGSGNRCTEKELSEAGHTPLRLSDTASDRAVAEYTCIDGITKKLKVKCLKGPSR